ncbi:MAG: histidinol-phosphate transaminase [Pseudomonadales bacterium]
MSYERDNIRQMQGYTSGEQPDDRATIKLNTNENPWAPAPAIGEAVRQFDLEDLRRYPQPTADEFRRLAADLHGVKPDNIIATRGGDELLRLVITTFVDPGQPIGMTEPTYSLYPVLAQIQNCPVIKTPLGEDWSLPDDFARTMNESGAKLSLLVNPHAPSGTLLDIETIRKIADAVDSVLLVDEAYVDFVDEDAGYDSISLIEDFDNVIILRTLSKGYSLAGLRFGYGIAAESLIRPMIEKTRDSYNLDAISQTIAETALANRDHAAWTWQQIRTERERLRSALAWLGFSSPESQANFLLVTVNNTELTAKDVYEKLKHQGILVRYFDQPGLQDKLRITIGTPAENQLLIRHLEALRGTDC